MKAEIKAKKRALRVFIQISALLTALVCITSALAPSCLAGEGLSATYPYSRGDADGDGVIGIKDFVTVRLHLLGVITLTGDALHAADANGDGIITVSDFITLRLELLGVAFFERNETEIRVDSLYGHAPDRTSDKANLLHSNREASYSYSRKPSATYPDTTGRMLTDGTLADSFNGNDWVGFNGRNELTVIIDLGSVTEGIADVSAKALRSSSCGIGLCSEMKLYISDNGIGYTYINSALSSATAADESGYSYDLFLNRTVSARYIKLVFSGNNSAWFFLGEIELCKYDFSLYSGYYGLYGTEKTEPVFWKPSSPGYTAVSDLTAGLVCQIREVAAIDETYRTEYYNTSEIASRSKLTDGKRAEEADFLDEAYFHFTRSSGRFLLFDLGAVSAVSSASFEFLKQYSTGVAPPLKVKVYVSENGVDFGKAGEASPASTAESEIFKTSLAFDKTYKARYVAVYFSVSAHVWCSEVDIMGTKKIPVSAVSASIVDWLNDANDDQIPSAQDGEYLMPDDFCGVNNVMLSYHCLRESNGSKSESGLITVDEYLPYVGYYDKQGTLKDAFFDGFLYLPYTAFNYSDYGKSAAGWQFYLDNQFTEGRNMSALNTAVSQVKAKLGKSDYMVSVFCSILYPFKEISTGANTRFGDVDGDGVNEDLTAANDRRKAVKWMIDTQIARFESGGYNNLSLKGFYWFEESITTDPDDKVLIRYVSDYLHSKGYVLFWIPWFKAAGYDKWQEYGFDAACMQPNYAFSASVMPSRLYINAALTKSLGMCVEFESNGTSYAAVSKIKEYLAAGVETGFMNAVKMYYQGGVPGDIYYASRSSDPYVRSAYDEIYLYSKAKLTKSDFYEADTSDPTLVSSGLTANKTVGKIGVANSVNCNIHITLSPKYGTIRLDKDGSFVYTPFQGYKGMDSFMVYADYGYTQSNTVSITITAAG